MGSPIPARNRLKNLSKFQPEYFLAGLRRTFTVYKAKLAYLEEGTSALQVVTKSRQECHCQLSYCCWCVSSTQLGGGGGGGCGLGVGSTLFGTKEGQCGHYSCKEAV